MSSHIQRLAEKKLLLAPDWLAANIHYEVIMGSVAYGVSSDTSDMDVYAFAIPPRENTFPQLAGEIQGFGKQQIRFEVFQKHHIKDKERDKEYDIAAYSIVRYFDLCMDNNPNMIDSLFVPDRCVLYASKIGQMVRERRRIFLHRGAWHKFKGYSYQQLHKMEIKQPQEGSKRAADIAKHGYDLKFAYHIVRLLLEIEQILTEGDLDLERHREQLKSIRRGEWSLQDIKDFFTQKSAGLEELYHKSDTLPYKPNEEAIKDLLIDCLEEAYGSLEGFLKTGRKVQRKGGFISNVLNLVRKA